MGPLIPAFPVVKFPITDDFAIHGFGILVALGFIYGSRMSMRKAARDGLDPELINRVVGWMVAGVFIGGHLGHLLFYYPEQILKDPMVLFRVWEGLSSFGGFVGCTLLAIYFFRREDRLVARTNKQREKKSLPLLPRVNILGYADGMLFGFTLGWFLGRMGCFVAHDHAGVETDSILGVYGMCRDAKVGLEVTCDGVVSCAQKVVWLAQNPRQSSFGPACHDLGLYEALWSLAMIPFFKLLDRKPRFPGFFTGMWLLSYGPVRLALDAVRTEDTRYFGVTPAQIGSVLMILGGAYILWSNRNKVPLVVEYGQRKAAELAAGLSEPAKTEDPGPSAG
jgi:phosphatidylglycerol:prolipoprotein diacylglycerol transferase